MDTCCDRRGVKPSCTWDGMWRVSALSWCTLVGSLSDDPMKTQPIYGLYDLRQTKATVR